MNYNSIFDAGCNVAFWILPIFFVIKSALLFFLTEVFTVIPIVDILAPVNTVTVFIYLFVLTRLVVKTPFCHVAPSQSLRTYCNILNAADFFASFFEDDFSEKDLFFSAM